MLDSCIFLHIAWSCGLVCLGNHATHLADQRSALDCLQSGDVLLVLGSQTEHGHLQKSDRCFVNLFLDRCGVYPQAFSTWYRVQNYERKFFSFSLSLAACTSCSCLFYPQTASNGLHADPDWAYKKEESRSKGSVDFHCGAADVKISGCIWCLSDPRCPDLSVRSDLVLFDLFPDDNWFHFKFKWRRWAATADNCLTWCEHDYELEREKKTQDTQLIITY